jgi:hypothetical protein
MDFKAAAYPIHGCNPAAHQEIKRGAIFQTSRSYSFFNKMK